MVNKEIIRLSSIQDQMVEQFRKGKQRGEPTGFPDIDNHFTWMKKDLNLMTGFANVGKSEMILQLMLLKSVMNDWKWICYSPENMPADQFYDSLIHSYVGKSVDKTFLNVMHEKEYIGAFDFIQKHFILVYPEDDFSLDHIFELFLEVMKDEVIDGTLIDPWNQIDHVIESREDLYLSKQLSLCKRFAIKNNICFNIVAHPKSVPRDANGEMRVPDHMDLSGGMMWANKIDNVLATSRPDYFKDKTSTRVEFHSHKIKKQKLVGIPGKVTLDFNRRTNRYSQMNGYTPLDNKELTLF